MAKQFLKDFKSFLYELNEGEDDWRHARADENIDVSFGHKGKNPPPALVKGSGSHEVRLSYWPAEAEENQPYTVEHHKGLEAFSKLSHALDYMKKMGHSVPEHHVKNFKERALEHASRNKD